MSEVQSNFQIANESLGVSVNQIVLTSLPFILPTTLVAVRGIGDRWLLASFLGISDLAGYTVLLQIGFSPMILLFGMIQTFLSPKIYSYGSLMESRDLKKLKIFMNKILIFILIGTIIACFGVIFTAEFVFDYLVGGNYHNLVNYLPYFVIAGGFSAAAGILQVAIIGVFKSQDAGKLVVITLLISLVCVVCCIYLAGFTGAVGGLLMSSCLTFLVYWWKLNSSLLASFEDLN